MMHTAEALRVVRAHRGDAIVVPGRGGRHWVNISQQTRRWTCRWAIRRWRHAGFALVLALAQPGRRSGAVRTPRAICWMSLGMLATIAEQAPANFYHFMLDNECYGDDRRAAGAERQERCV